MSQVHILGLIATSMSLVLTVGACQKETPETPSDPVSNRVEVTSVTLSVVEATLEVDKTTQLIVTVLPTDATDPSVGWTSSSPLVATVSSTGLVKAVSEGSATISAKAGSMSATCLVTVTKPYVGVQSISLDRAFVVLSIEESLSLKATVMPSDATRPAVTWTSSQTAVAAVSSEGIVTATGEGEAMITAEADGVKATCQISVFPAPPPANRIEYTSLDGFTVVPYNTEAFGAKIVSNTYQDGVGVIEFDGPVTQVGEKAFFQCDKLASVSLPAGVDIIGPYAFYYTSLMRISMQNKITEIGNFAFGWCSSLTTLTLPDNLAKTGSSAFQSCSALSQVILPEGIQEIKSSAFSDCVSLKSLRVNAATPPTLGSRALDNSANCPIYVPVEAVGTYKSATGWRSYAARIHAIP